MLFQFVIKITAIKTSMKVTLIVISSIVLFTKKIKRKKHVETMFLNISVIHDTGVTQLLVNCYKKN